MLLHESGFHLDLIKRSSFEDPAVYGVIVLDDAIQCSHVASLMKGDDLASDEDLEWSVDAHVVLRVVQGYHSDVNVGVCAYVGVNANGDAHKHREVP